MFYRVDYALAVLLAGFLAGLLVSKTTENITPTRLARSYYVAVAMLLVMRTGVFAYITLGSRASFWSSLSGLFGDLLGLLFGALFGLAVRRKDARRFLSDPFVLKSLCMALAFTFALAGIGKAFSMSSMTDFFTQSGYSVPFLKFIVIAEIFGGIGLLLPWAILPALIGLTIDMFGAVLTHIHNGDPLNDSTGAIGMLIRLVALGILWNLREQNDESSPSTRRAILSVSAITIACLLVAVGGSAAVRHLGPSPTAMTAPASK